MALNTITITLTLNHSLSCHFYLINCLSLSAIDLIKKLMTVDVKKRITLEEAINHPWFKVSLRITLEEAINHPWFKVSISFLLTDSFCSHFIPWPEMSSLVSSSHKYMRNEQVLCPHLTNLLKKNTNNYWVSTKIMVLSPIVHCLCAICCLLFLPPSEVMFN